jgi:deoxyribonuclease-4
MSISGGLHLALERGHSIGCESIQIFTRNQTRWKSKKRTPDELEQYRQTLIETGIAPVVAHAIYLINLGSPDEPVREKSNAAFVEELERCHQAGIPYLVMHPGSHKGTGLEQGIARIAEGINHAYATHPEFVPSDQGGVMILLENTAGQGSTIGRSFVELARIAEQIDNPATIGYCFDTAHGLAAGYELRTPEGYEATWAQFNELLGLEQLRCFHLNDSKYDLQQKRDRHQHIGEGFVGLDAFRMLVNDPRFVELPMLLETPKSADLHEDVKNLNKLKELLA